MSNGSGQVNYWPCAFVDENGIRCKIRLNDLNQKNKPRTYCEPHAKLKQKIDSKARWKKWNEKRKQELLVTS